MNYNDVKCFEMIHDAQYDKRQQFLSKCGTTFYAAFDAEAPRVESLCE